MAIALLIALTPSSAASAKSSATGRVLSPDGEPVPGALVYAIHILDPSGDGAYPAKAVHADASGRFSYDSLDDGLYTFTAHSPDYARGIVKGVTVPPGGRIDDLEIVLERGEAITGQVITADGKPAAGARVESLELMRSTITDAEGLFRLAGIPRGTPRVGLIASREGYETAREITAPGASGVILVLAPKVTVQVRGRVLAEQGVTLTADREIVLDPEAPHASASLFAPRTPSPGHAADRRRRPDVRP